MIREGGRIVDEGTRLRASELFSTKGVMKVIRGLVLGVLGSVCWVSDGSLI